MLPVHESQFGWQSLKRSWDGGTRWPNRKRSACNLLPVLLLPATIVLFFPATWPRWAFMWTLAFATYCGCKWLTWTRAPKASLSRQFGYWLLWPGLDAASFLDARSNRPARRVTIGEWSLATANLVVGLILLFVVARWTPSTSPYLVGWVGMIGIVLALHFGLFHFLSCGWRFFGVDARPVMNWPMSSVSVSEFWGRRWNTAFRDLANRFLFRPLIPRYGHVVALWTGFFISGLIHELVISVPAGGGYGGPTLYFLIQALAILVSRAPVGRRLGLGIGVSGWTFTVLVVIGPAGLLLHWPFVDKVILPFMAAIGALG